MLVDKRPKQNNGSVPMEESGHLLLPERRQEREIRIGGAPPQAEQRPERVRRRAKEEGPEREEEPERFSAAKGQEILPLPMDELRRCPQVGGGGGLSGGQQGRQERPRVHAPVRKGGIAPGDE